ncbi:hypothetical protein SJAV_23600 [Sulfurisphaera javensis]|uniref:FAD/NAD(P)-binding domain-containing protein n=1 Tax=Sulfurisphaera javensis TaxID=2049879 RepID=A0AAT9GUN5_9CREN
MKTLIIGTGYAGLNAFHVIKDAELVSDNSTFIFYTAYLRSLFFGGKFSKKLNFIKEEKVIEYDLKSKWVKTTKNEYNVDNLIVAAGCDKNEIINTINTIVRKDKVSISSEDPFNDYLAIQIAFYLRKLGKEVKYNGRYMDYLGDKISSTILKYTEKYGIKYTEKAEDILPSCKPSYPFNFFKVNEYLQYENSFIIGDLISGFPKLGELAMRSGIYVGNYILGKTKKPFKPIFITIIDTGREGIHIRSDRLWGGSTEIVKVSKIRQLMKRFIEKYYLIRNGKMGFLYYL